MPVARQSVVLVKERKVKLGRRGLSNYTTKTSINRVTSILPLEIGGLVSKLPAFGGQ